MSEYLTIRNWKRFQHYKDRNPPWIKLHYELLTSPDWVMVSDASKLLAVVCMMLASRKEGQVLCDPSYIQKVANLSARPCFKQLIAIGFFDDASAMLADASTKTETEAYKTDIPPNPQRGDFKAFYSAYPKRISPKDAEKAYLKAIKSVGHEEIMVGVTKYANHVKDIERQYIQAPAAWLNKGRWADDYGETKQEKTGFARAGL